MIREEKGWSIATLADRSGLHPNTISKLERGDNSPSLEAAAAIAKALEKPLEAFLLAPGEVLPSLPEKKPRGRPRKET